MKNTINSFIDKLIKDYTLLFGKEESHFLQIINSAGKLALNTIAKSNAAYHDVHHTMMVADVGQEILKGKQILEKNVSPSDWFHFTIAALFHDIGYIRGLCNGDKEGEYIKNIIGETVQLSRFATDAALAPYHVDRAKLYASKTLERLKSVDHVFIVKLIERTRFPVPNVNKYKKTNDLPGLLRAADLIGQIADVNYTKKSEALFSELLETGSAQKLGYKTSYDLRVKFPVFFENQVNPYIKEALKYLNASNSGKKWVNSLFISVASQNPSFSKITSKNSPYQGPLANMPHAAYGGEAHNKLITNLFARSPKTVLNTIKIDELRHHRLNHHLRKTLQIGQV